MNGTNPATGNPRLFEIHTSPGGGSVIVIRDQNLTGNTTVTDSTTITVGPSGSIDSVVGGSNLGGLPSPDTVPAGPVVQPAAYPSDYARTGEAAAAAASTNASSTRCTAI